MKNIEEKMMSIIAAEDKLNQQYKLLTSIPGIGRQTAVYLLIATKGFDVFDNWRQLACYAGVAPLSYQSGTSSDSIIRCPKSLTNFVSYRN